MKRKLAVLLVTALLGVSAVIPVSASEEILEISVAADVNETSTENEAESETVEYDMTEDSIVEMESEYKTETDTEMTEEQTDDLSETTDMIVLTLSEETDADNKCGDNITWKLENGVLTISGSGKMYDYGPYWEDNNAPWFDDRGSVTSVIIENGVESIGAYAFYGCENLVNLSIADSVTVIGSDAFEECKGLTSIVISDSVVTIEEYAFFWCTGVTSVTLGNNVTTIGEAAFDGCNSLTSMTIPSSVTSIGDMAIGYEFNMSEYGKGSDPMEFTIYGYAGTAAETYAATSDTFTFIDLSKTDVSETETETESVSETKIEITSGLSEVPLTLLTVESLNTTEKIESTLQLKVMEAGGCSEENIVIYDVTLMVSSDGGVTWTEATEENFPEGGLTITLPYPEGTGKDTHDFTVVHMFTSDAFGKTPGDTEVPAVTKTDAGIQVTLTGLSPVAVGWNLITASSETPATESETSTESETASQSETETETETETEKSTEAESVQTGDNAPIGIYTALMLFAAIMMAEVLIRKRFRECSGK